MSIGSFNNIYNWDLKHFWTPSIKIVLPNEMVEWNHKTIVYSEKVEWCGQGSRPTG